MVVADALFEIKLTEQDPHLIGEFELPRFHEPAGEFESHSYRLGRGRHLVVCRNQQQRRDAWIFEASKCTPRGDETGQHVLTAILIVGVRERLKLRRELELNRLQMFDHGFVESHVLVAGAGIW